MYVEYSSNYLINALNRRLLNIIFLLCLYFGIANFLPKVNATLLYSDSFSGGYNTSDWYVLPVNQAPISSSFGITGASNSSWSAIRYGVTNNYTYLIKFDLKINFDRAGSGWGVGIVQNYTPWKLAGNWENLVQVHDSTGSNLLVPWNHSIGLHHFDVIVSPQGGTNFQVKEDNKILGNLITQAEFTPTAIDLSILGNGDYEMANFSLSTYEESTPTPTDIPTPTDTPTPTLTPTPTMIPTSKVVVIPGIGGSWSGKLLACDMSPGGSWELMPVYGWSYSSLMSTLTANGFTVLPYYYDWRQHISSITEKFSNFVNEQSATNEKVDIVAHSMGGLLARDYIDRYGSSQKIDRLLTAGTPHRGTPIAYPALSAAELWMDSPAAQFGFTYIKKWCGYKTGISDVSAIQQYIPSLYDLLPIDPYLISKSDGSSIVGQLQNPWLQNSQFPTSLSGTIFKTLSGTGLKTLSSIIVGDPKKDSWIDGKAIQKIWSDTGDGTVLNASSMIEGRENESIQSDHQGIIGSSEGQNNIIEFLGKTPLTVTAASGNYPESSLAIITYPAWIWVTDPNGALQKDTEGLVVFGNPSGGTYKYVLTPKTIGETRIAVAQFLKNGDIKWKDYYHHGILPKIGTITFDPENASEDILQ